MNENIVYNLHNLFIAITLFTLLMLIDNCNIYKKYGFKSLKTIFTIKEFDINEKLVIKKQFIKFWTLLILLLLYIISLILGFKGYYYF